MKKISLSQKVFVICLVLVFLVLSVYLQTWKFDFVNIDDDIYVYNNSHVQSGLSFENIKWAFSNTETALWIPLTWLSLMFDSTFFGNMPGAFHLINVFFHLANSILLFFFLFTLTKSIWRSALVAAIFAVHPLQVESVAWITERKDVLSLFFMLMSLNIYLLYNNKKKLIFYFLSLIFFAFGLMAKPMLVSLPFILLLIDFYIFKHDTRLRNIVREQKRGFPDNFLVSRDLNLRRIMIDKAPFFALAVVVSAVTIFAAGKDKALMGLDSLPFIQRAGQAFIFYVLYLAKIFLPLNLAVYYPYKAVMPALWKILSAAVLLAAVTMSTIMFRKKHPYLLFGWFWYLITLFPVIGLFQAGSQSMADRFTYIPIAGIIIISIWGISEIFEKIHIKGRFLWPFSAAVIITLTAASYIQAGYWKDSVTLFSRALSVTDSNWFAHNGLGVGYERNGDISKAVTEYKKALSINPDFYYAHYNLARVYGLTGNYKGAEEHFSFVFKVRPDFADAAYNLALALEKQGKYDEAVNYYNRCLEITPGYFEARWNLALLYEVLKNYPEAIKHFTEITKIKPELAEIYYHLGNIYAESGNSGKAVEQYNTALKIKPDFAEALNTLGNVLEYQGRIEDAVAAYKKALSFKPGSEVLLRNLGSALKKLGKTNEAEKCFSTVDSLEKIR